MVFCFIFSITSYTTVFEFFLLAFITVICYTLLHMNTKKILQYCLMAGLFLVPFLAFIVPNGMFFPFITGKGFSFRILTEILFGLYVILAFMAPEYRPKKSWISWSLIIFAFVMLLADLFSANVAKSLWRLRI